MKLRFLWLVCLLLPYSYFTASAQDYSDLPVTDYRKSPLLESNRAEYKVLLKRADSLAYEGQYSKAASIYLFITERYGASTFVTMALGYLYRKMGRLNEARKLYAELYSTDSAAAATGMAHCDFATHALSKVANYDTYLLPFNTPASEFGLSFLRGYPGYSAFRCQEENSEEKHSCSASIILYDEEKSALQSWRNTAGVDFESVNICEQGHKAVGFIEMSPDRHSLGQKAGPTELFILSITENNTIEKADLFPYSDMYSAIHSACLSADGTELIFSARDSKEGEGFDLFASVWIDNRWTLPVSLGETINTSGNEITPNMHNNALYFASDQHPGLGGFDLFVSGRVEAEWLPPHNFGNGINSLGDDYFPALDGSGKIFFTSNRQGGMGKNDLYYGFRMSDDALPKTEIPAAVVLQNSIAENDNIWYPNRYAKPVAYTEKQSKEIKLPQENLLMAKHTAQSKVAASPVPGNEKPYYIQVISSTTPNSTKIHMEAIRHFGDIYEIKNGNSIKFQLGKFTSQDEARQMLTSVKKAGYMDAFITQNKDINPSSILLKLKKPGKDVHKTEPKSSYPKKEEYKVRIGAFSKENPVNQASLEELGTVERWTKGKFVILVISGFEDMQSAKHALQKAIQLGYNDAQLVVERGGIFHRVRK